MLTPGNHVVLTLNALTLQVGGGAGWVDISDADRLLLEAFADSPTRRLERAQMLVRIGKAGNANDARALDVQIVRLRRKLEQAGASSPTIKSIRGVGYQLCVPLHVLPAHGAAAAA